MFLEPLLVGMSLLGAVPALLMLWMAVPNGLAQPRKPLATSPVAQPAQQRGVFTWLSLKEMGVFDGAVGQKPVAKQPFFLGRVQSQRQEVAATAQQGLQDLGYLRVDGVMTSGLLLLGTQIGAGFQEGALQFRVKA